MEVFILKENGAFKFHNWEEMWVFSSFDRAKDLMNARVKQYLADQDTTNPNLIIEENDISFSCYQDGYYDEEHYELLIHVKEME